MNFALSGEFRNVAKAVSHDAARKVSVNREESETVEATSARCAAVYDDLRKKYPIG